MSEWWGRFQAVVRAGFRSRIVWAFAAIWLIAVGVLAAAAELPIFGLIYNLGLTLFVILTIIATDDAPHSIETGGRNRTYLQIGFILLIIVLTSLGGMAFHSMIEPVSIPIWTDINRALGGWAYDLLGSSTYFQNPFQYFIVPFIVLLLMGARPAELGFGRGHHVWRVVLIWCVIPILIMLYMGISGAASFERIGRLIFSNALNNGFFEEFLFRGALQTRLRKWMKPGWAIVISGLVFGVWHLGLGYSTTGALIPALASTIVYQAFLGVVFGIIFERTRNLIAPSIVHVALNVVGTVING